MPAARGMQWLLEGIRIFLSAPFGWLVIALSYIVLVMLLSAIPVVGAPVGLILYPGFTVGFLIASRASALRQPVNPAMLFSGFRERAPQQIALGCAYFGGVVIAVLGSWFADDGALLRLLFRAGDAIQREQDVQLASNAFLVILLLYLPTFMMVFYAPVLTAWHSMSPAKALFFSFVACLLNWRALLCYVGLGILLMFIATNLVFFVVLGFAGAEARANPAQLIPALAPTLLLVFLPVMMTSSFASYRDVFAVQESA